MISLELAKKLKEAGLEWKPKKGDFYGVFGTNSIELITIDRNDIVPRNIIWLPSLDQLLAEIEKRGYGWKLEKFHAYNLRRMEIYKVNDLLGCFGGNSPEEAAASALLWILEGGISDV